jgi:hypothetical protein
MSGPSAGGALVPAEVDLRNFLRMPLQVGRLLGSDTWMAASDDPRLGHALMSLWAAAWQQVPAGSLPNLDASLQRFSLCPTAEEWQRIKQRALSGWRLATDGRLYHPVVCEMALECWLVKLQARLKGGRGNATQHGVGFDEDGLVRQMHAASEALRELNPMSEALAKTRMSLKGKVAKPARAGRNGGQDAQGGAAGVAGGGAGQGAGQGGGQGGGALGAASAGLVGQAPLGGHAAASAPAQAMLQLLPANGAGGPGDMPPLPMPLPARQADLGAEPAQTQDTPTVGYVPVPHGLAASRALAERLRATHGERTAHAQRTHCERTANALRTHSERTANAVRTLTRANATELKGYLSPTPFYDQPVDNSEGPPTPTPAPPPPPVRLDGPAALPRHVSDLMPWQVH